jgi:hypothetical protein
MIMKTDSPLLSTMVISPQRIAYLDPVISVLLTLLYEVAEEEWLSHRAKAAQVWLLDQGMIQAR